MKNFILIFVLLALASTAMAQTNTSTRYQGGYVKSDGSYVPGHFKTSTNDTNRDNFATKPNTNNYTGEKGSRAKDYSPEAKNYGQGHAIQTGPKGGQFYVNDKGNKVYVPKQ